MTGDGTVQILVIKHGALGDMVQGFDALASLRASFASAHICLLTSPAFVRLAGQTGWFDEIVADPRARPWNLPAFFSLKRLFSRRWTMVIDLQCSARTARYHRHFAKDRPGLRWFGIAPGCSDPMPDFTGVNNAERMLVAVRMAGAKSISADLSFLAGQPLSAPLAAACPDRFSLLIAGCSLAKPSKRWPADRFAELAKALIERQIQPILIGTDADQDALAAIAGQVPQIVNWQSRTSLSDLLVLASRAQSIIGNDTGPTFLAARSGRPCIMVMGKDTDPASSAPVGAGSRWIKKDQIADITARDVLDLLDNGSG